MRSASGRINCCVDEKNPFEILNSGTNGKLNECATFNRQAQRVVRVLDRVAAWRGYPEKLRVDNGPELTSVKLADWAEEHGVVLEYTQPGKPTQNGFVERFNRTYRNEVLSAYVFTRLSEVRDITANWLIEYNEERP
ncbi:MAG: integrase core domain-containing protein, partial [Nitrospinota bacterium]|nr:integrase core domain-containing protein [Nitrospinota bacterium]